MTVVDHTIEELDQLAATYRFLAVITELRARARAAACSGDPATGERLESEANFLSRQLPVTPPVCHLCGRPVAPRERRVCVHFGDARARQRA